MLTTMLITGLWQWLLLARGTSAHHIKPPIINQQVITSQPEHPTASLDPSCRPGGNFDLTPWALQLPLPDNKGFVLQIPPNQLSPSPKSKACTTGYQDPTRSYFFTESGDGAMVMKAPGNPELTHCTKFAESSHCRTEFAEVAHWKSASPVNRLSVTLLAVAGGNTCIGQVFQAAPNPNRPLCELYYYGNGSLFLGVAQAAVGGNQKLFDVGFAAFGTKFTYGLSFEAGKLGFALNGGARRIMPTYFSTPNAFFKAGNYNQDRTATTASIHVFGIDVDHGEGAKGISQESEL